MKNNIDFTKERITKALIRFAIPLCATYFLQLMYSTIDIAIVGKYVGEEGIAAISSSSEIINLYTFFCIGFCNGGQTLIAQLIGLKNKDRFKEAIDTLLISSLILGLIVCIFTIIFKNGILTILKVPSESFIMASSYLAITAIGLIFSFVYNALIICFRAFGDSKHPFEFVLVSTIVNIVLDLLFTGALKMGVKGVAIATLIGQIIACLLALIYFANKSLYPNYTYSLKNFKFNDGDFKIMLSIGMPLAIQSAIIHFSMLFVHRLINSLGVSAAACFAIGIKIVEICSKTSLGFQYAGGPIVSQNFAVGNNENVEKTIKSIWLIAGVYHIIYALIFILFYKELFSLFIKDNSLEVLSLAKTFVEAIIYTFIPLAILRGTNALLIGIGEGKLSLTFSLLDSVVGRIGLSYLFGYIFNLGFYGFVFGYGLAPLGAALPGTIYFLKGKWKNKKKLA